MNSTAQITRRTANTGRATAQRDERDQHRQRDRRDDDDARARRNERASLGRSIELCWMVVMVAAGCGPRTPDSRRSCDMTLLLRIQVLR